MENNTRYPKKNPTAVSHCLQDNDCHCMPGSGSMHTMETFIFRPPQLHDLNALLAIEYDAFSTDQLNRRRMRHWILADNRAFLICTTGKGDVAGYILIFYRNNSSVARLYSIAVSPRYRGHGLARQLLSQGEALTMSSGRKAMRLEVRPGNHAAIALYQKQGYQQFGIYRGFYEDGEDALRFEKTLSQTHPASARMRSPGTE